MICPHSPAAPRPTNHPIPGEPTPPEEGTRTHNMMNMNYDIRR